MRVTIELAQEIGYAKLSIEAVAARAGVGKHTVYRRWPSKAMLFHDSLLQRCIPPCPTSPTPVTSRPTCAAACMRRSI